MSESFEKSLRNRSGEKISHYRIIMLCTLARFEIRSGEVKGLKMSKPHVNHLPSKQVGYHNENVVNTKRDIIDSAGGESVY